MRSLILSLVLCAASTAGAQGLGGPGFGSGADTPGAASTSTANTFAGESTFNAPVNCGTEVISFAATMNIDASTKPCKSIAATGNFTLTTSNLAPTRVVTITITADGTDRTMAFPAGWTWVGTTTPGTIVANSTSVIEIRSGTSADSGVTAKYWTKDGAPLLGKQLVVSNDGQTTPAFAMALLAEYDSAVGVRLIAHSNSVPSPLLQGQASRGTRLLPTHLLANDIMFGWSSLGYGTTGLNFNGPQIKFAATEDFTDTNSGSEIDFFTCAKLGVGCLNTMTLQDDGALRVTGRSSSRITVGNNQISESIGIGLYPSLASDTDDSATSGDIDMVQHGSFQSSLVFVRTRGTHASPAPVLNGDTLGEILAQGWAASGLVSNGPDILFKTTEDWATGPIRNGSRIALQTFKNLNGGFNQWIFDQDGSTTLPGTLVVPSTITEERDGADPSVTLAAHATSPFNSIPRLSFKASRGTAASPTAIQNGDLLGSINMSGYNGTLYQTNAPSIFFTAMENWSVGHNAAEIDFTSCAIGNSCPVTMTLQTDGKLSVPAGFIGGPLTASSTLTANGQVALGITVLTPAASVAIDFAATASPTKSLAVSQNTTFTTSNLSAGVTDTVYLTTDASARTPTWPAGWKWVGSVAPTSLAASTTSVLTLTSTTTADSGVLASLAAQNATVNLSTDVSGGPLATSLGGSGNTTNAGVLISVVKATSGTTITSPSATHNADVTVCGGGGGGGGTTTAAASAAVGGGGASGSCTRKFYTGLLPLTAYTVSFGAAGTAGSSSGGNGGTGGDATFTDGVTLITGKGGLGGLGESAGTVAGYTDGGAVVTGTNGDWFGGMPGTYGSRATGLIGIAGNGGSCPFGAGAVGSSTAGIGASATGNCAGGAGGVVLNNSAAVAGGAGSAPILVVRWYQ